MVVIDLLDFRIPIATASVPSGPSTNDGCNWASDCMVVVGRMCSSWPRWWGRRRPYRHHRFVEAASSQAFAALLALDRAGVSCREKPYLVAIRSAETPCGMNRTAPPPVHRRRRKCRCRRGSLIRRRHNPSCWLLMIWAAKFTASRPEAQKRLICTPGTASPSPVSAPRSGRCRSRLRRLTDHAEHDVVDHNLAKIVAVLQRLQRHAGERQRGDFPAARRLACAAARSNVIVDIASGMTPS